MIRLYIARYIGCALALLGVCWLLNLPFDAGIFAQAALLAGLYAVIKPIYSFIALPLDMFFFGLGTLCLDALMIRLVMPYDFKYWQALAVAAAIALCFAPYEKWRERVRGIY